MRARVTAIATTLACVAAAGIAVASPAQAMGSGNPYEDLQVGVTYTVYQPGFTAALKIHHTGNTLPCSDGSDENLVAEYGNQRTRGLSIIEGKPICSDAGEAKTVATVRVNGAKATVRVFCDPSNDAEWTTCSRSDMATYGGYLSVTLPGQGSLRATDVIVTTSGTRPLSARKLIKVARGLTPVAGDPSLIGGMVTCTQGALSDAVQGGMGKGEELVSVNSFRCADGWAVAEVTVGDGKGHDYDTVVVLEAEGQFWILKDRGKACGTDNGQMTRPVDAQIPASLWKDGCTTS